MSGALQLLGQLVHNREGTTQNEVSELNINMMPEADENTITLIYICKIKRIYILLY